MPIKESFLHITCGLYYFHVITKPINGNTAELSLEYDMGKGPMSLKTIATIHLHTWYVLMVRNRGDGFQIEIHELGNHPMEQINTFIKEEKPIHTLIQHEINTNRIDNCQIRIGTNSVKGPNMYGTTSFYYDIVSVQFWEF
jgi:hypothetical protein